MQLGIDGLLRDKIAEVGLTDAVRRYKLTDADFARASGRGLKAAQNAAQSMHAENRLEPQREPSAHEKSPVFQCSAALSETLPNGGVGDIGLEPMTPSLSSWCSNQLS